MYKLVIQDDEGKTTVVPLIRDELTIGRKEGNTIRLTERNVSRRHARLIRQNGSITIEDLNSYNGIRVNGSRIQGSCQIRETDRVQIGDYLIELKSEVHEKGDTLSERTVPIERIDPHASTPVPDAVEPNDSAIATARMTKADSAALLGTGFVGAAGEASPPLSDTDPSASPVPAGAPDAGTRAPAPETHAAANARLVVLSTTFAGREFELDKPAMVIGRTEDNDVCISHRSISRHHAKVVCDNGRYAIVDLQSSNGVRVNGEEYGKVELRRADVIDLGHVRLRFVESGEDFVFGRDAQAMDVEHQGTSRIAMWVALALLVVGGAVVLFLAVGSGQDGRPGKEGGHPAAADRAGTRGAVGGGGSRATAVTAPAVSDTGVVTGAAETAPQVSDEISKLLEEARKAVEAEHWNAALTAAKAALEADPTSRAAQALMDQAESEMANEQIHKQFARAVSSRDYTKVAELYRRLDPESVYRVMAQPDHDRLKQEYVGKHSRDGKRLADRGKCRDQERLAADVGRVWPEAGRVVLSHPCKQNDGATATTPGTSGALTSPAAATSPALVPAPGGTTTSVTTTPTTGTGGNGGTATAANGGVNFGQLLEQSRQAAGDGDYEKSLRFCEQAVDKKPNDQTALMVCGIASCRLKSVARARKFLRRINSNDMQQSLRTICFQDGVKDL